MLIAALLYRAEIPVDLLNFARVLRKVLDIGCYKAPDTNLSIILR